jgi:membrane fusion protein, multidrug efflux system
MKLPSIASVVLVVMAFSVPACNKHKAEVHHESHTIVATSPERKAITLTQQYVCQIHSQRHIKIRAMEMGYLEAISLQEGQKVKTGDLMFNVNPMIYKAKYDAELAKKAIAQLDLNFTTKLVADKVVSNNEKLMAEAKLKEATAKAELAAAELGFSMIKAPFDGIIDRLMHQQGSLVQEGEILTTLSDNSLMWVYFNVPEKDYLKYMTELKDRDDLKIELKLANGEIYNHPGKRGPIEADFNNETGNIKFRADFPNPESLLRHGQTGTILISRIDNDAIVIPQRAVFEVLEKRYVYVVDKDDVAHQREIFVRNELEDLYVIKKGVDVDDKIVLEGIRQIHDGEKVEYEDRHPDHVAANLKNRAE